MIINPIYSKFNNLIQFKSSPKGVYNSNLAPLAKDTVSFGEGKYLEAESMVDAPSANTCNKVHKCAEAPCYYLQKVLEKYVQPYTQDENYPGKKNFQVFKYETRVKSPSSIKEKVISKFTKICSTDIKDFIDILFPKLDEYFYISEKNTISHIKDDAAEIIKSKNDVNKISPFTNPEHYIRIVIDELESRQELSLKDVPKKELNKVIKEISRDISDLKRPNEHIHSGTYYSTKSEVGIKHYANDIVGARILMNDSSPSQTGKVLKALEQAVNDDALKITSIECSEPDPKRLPKGRTLKDYIYAFPRQLNSLAKAAGAELIRKKSKSGYLAIHINIDLSNSNFPKETNGFTGEIQIIGVDVEKLKNIEDLCYKLKDNKHSINSKYKDFVEYFSKYYINADEKTKKAFDDYTYDLYLYQRDIPAGQRGNSRFPSIKTLGYEGRIPKELDYNLLKTLKDNCELNDKISSAKDIISYMFK